MLIVRFILLIVFGLLFVGLLFVSFNSTTPTSEGTWSLLGLFLVIIVVLGPLWPSQEKIENPSLKLPTDNPKVAKPLALFAISCVSFYSAVSEWLSPSPYQGRMVRTIYSLLGSNGVVLFWVFVGLFCLVAAYNAYKHLKTA